MNWNWKGCFRIGVPVTVSLILIYFFLIVKEFQSRNVRFQDNITTSQDMCNNHAIIEDGNGICDMSYMKEAAEDRDDSIENETNETPNGKDGIAFNLIPVKLSEIEKERIKEKFLKLLGMTNRPSSKLNDRLVPPELLDLFEKQTKSSFPTTDLFLPGKHTATANTVRILTSIDIKTSNNQHSEFNAIIKFNISTIPVVEQVTGAEIKVPFTFVPEEIKNNSAVSSLVRILMLDLVRLNDKNQESISYPTDSKLVNLKNRRQKTFWLTFDVVPAVLRWKDRERSNRGLAIKITKLDLNGKPVESGQSETVVNVLALPDKSPKLIIYSDDGHNAKARHRRDAKSISRKFRAAYHQHYHHYHHHHRYIQNYPPHPYGSQLSQPQFYRQPQPNHHQYSRRRKPHRLKNRKRNLCSRKSMFVDFTDVGWNDWIVAPPGYQAYYCSGECQFPLSEHMNATNHAVIQALISSMNPSLVPPPCCVPNKYSSLSLLYTDSSDRIVLKNYNEMIVDSCGCS